MNSRVVMLLLNHSVAEAHGHLGAADMYPCKPAPHHGEVAVANAILAVSNDTNPAALTVLCMEPGAEVVVAEETSSAYHPPWGVIPNAIDDSLDLLIRRVEPGEHKVAGDIDPVLPYGLWMSASTAAMEGQTKSVHATLEGNLETLEVLGKKPHALLAGLAEALMPLAILVFLRELMVTMIEECKCDRLGAVLSA